MVSDPKTCRDSITGCEVYLLTDMSFEFDFDYSIANWLYLLKASRLGFHGRVSITVIFNKKC